MKAKPAPQQLTNCVGALRKGHAASWKLPLRHVMRTKHATQKAAMIARTSLGFTLGGVLSTRCPPFRRQWCSHIGGGGESTLPECQSCTEFSADDVQEVFPCPAEHRTAVSSEFFAKLQSQVKPTGLFENRDAVPWVT